MLIAGRYQLLDADRPAFPCRARDLETAQTVLLREAPLPMRDADDAVARARAAEGVFHPSLVTLFTVVEVTQSKLLLAYESVTAQTLVQVSAGGPFHPRRAAAIVAEVADAVAELHARDVVHGGIIAANVLITLKGKTKLDRAGDPSIFEDGSTAADDLLALAEMLDALSARPAGTGVPGAQAIDTIVQKALRGGFQSAATFAAMLRRL